MSRNGSGTYSLPAGNPVVTGTTISSTWANSTLNDIASALTDSVAADGQTPMAGPLNMNSNKITALGAGNASGEAIEFAQFTTPTFTGNVTCASTGFIKIPAGTTAQRPEAPEVGEIRFNTSLLAYEGYKNNITGVEITSITNVTTLATLTTNGSHGLTTGMIVSVSGASPIQYNGSFTITVLSETEFTYVMSSTPSGYASPVGSYTYGDWSQIGGGATGGGNDQIFIENGQTVTTSYTITASHNAGTFGPISINSGVTVTIPDGSVWSIV